MMAVSRASRVFDLIGRVAMVALFGLVATKHAAVIVEMLRDPENASFLNFARRIANLAFVLLVVGMTIVRLKPIGNAQGLEPRVSALAGTFLLMAIAALPLADIGSALQITSLVLISAGWLLSAYVLLWLGRAFSIMAQARSLVTGGPYAVVRHPLYLCEAIATVGIVLSHLSVEAVLIFVVQWAFQLRRMTNEETVLRAVFPEYAAYAERTPKVIPRLYPSFRLRPA